MDLLKVFRNFLGIQLVVLVFTGGIVYQRLVILEKEAVERLTKLEDRVDELRIKASELHSRINNCESKARR